MSRKPNWPALLEHTINAARQKEFAWGTHDCCMFAADCALAITGSDPASGVRGTYTTEQGAGVIIAEAGGLHKYVQAVAAGLGWTRCKPTQARRGDWLLYTPETTRKPCLGVCVGALGAFASRSGLAFVQVSNCSNAWRVD